MKPICNFFPGLQIFSLIVFILLLSCHKKETIYPVVTPPFVDSTALPADSSSTTPVDTNTSFKTFLALGDSYTIGQSVDSSLRFPAQTASLLSGQNINAAPIRYIATTGWTTTNLINAIEQENPTGPYDIVTLLIGVNDQYQTNDTSGYRARFTSLLDKAVSLAVARSHVFVLSIPDWGVTPFGSSRPDVGKQIDLFNAINKDVTDSYGISYTDITTISRADAGDDTMLASDGLHPSGKQYKQWAQALEPKVYEVLK